MRTINEPRQLSIEAWNSVQPELLELQLKVLAILREAGSNGLADHEAIALTDMGPSTYRTRRSELVKLGLVVHTGEVRKTASNRRADVWMAKP